MSTLRNVHTKIAMIRKLKKLDSQTVADRIPLSLKAYQRLEKGETKCDMERLEQVAKALVSTDFSCLLHLDGIIKKQNIALTVMHLADVLASGI